MYVHYIVLHCGVRNVMLFSTPVDFQLQCVCACTCTLLFLPPPLLILSLLVQNVLSQLRHYDTTQPSLASDVKTYLSSASAAASMLTNKNKADRKSLVEMITNYQIMAGLVNLFEIDPMLAFSAPPQV